MVLKCLLCAAKSQQSKKEMKENQMIQNRPQRIYEVEHSEVYNKKKN